MFEEDRETPKPPDALERLSVDELEARIETLRAEIRACEDEMERKQAHKSAADKLFGSD